jgi:hypothetical protein
MNAMAPTRPTELHRCRLRLTTGSAAAAEARSQLRTPGMSLSTLTKRGTGDGT